MADDARRLADVTALLQQWRLGQRDALDELLRVVYDELRRMARGQLARGDRRNTLQSTELVHEAFLRLVDQRADWQNRVHFYGIAATCMRRILVDHARRKRAAKRPQAGAAVDLDTSIVGASSSVETILAVDEALTRLAAIDPRQATIAELKFFAGLDVPEIAEVVGVAPATVKRDWSAAKDTLATLLGAPQ
jgi:RNA polymerase sigma factor (TIGR02999 family)